MSKTSPKPYYWDTTTMGSRPGGVWEKVGASLFRHLAGPVPAVPSAPSPKKSKSKRKVADSSDAAG